MLWPSQVIRESSVFKQEDGGVWVFECSRELNWDKDKLQIKSS